MFLLDTNVLLEMRSRARVDPKVAAWAREIDPSALFISSITILEIEIGALSIERRDKAQGAMFRTWIDNSVLPAFEGRILPVDTAVAQRCVRLYVPDPRAGRDALIAATALVHRLKVVTRNVADFQSMGVELINPWEL